MAATITAYAVLQLKQMVILDIGAIATEFILRAYADLAYRYCMLHNSIRILGGIKALTELYWIMNSVQTSQRLLRTKFPVLPQ